MTDIRIFLPTSEALAPLYEKDFGDFGPWKAFMHLDEDGILSFGRNYDGSKTFAVAYGVDQSWRIPPELSHVELKAFAESMRPMLERVIEGLDLDWDDRISQYRGTLDSDAEEAHEEISSACQSLFEKVRDHDMGVYVLDPYECFGEDTLDDFGLSEDSSDDEIMLAAKEAV